MRKKWLTQDWDALPLKQRREALTRLEKHGAGSLPTEWFLGVAGEGSQHHRNLLAVDPATPVQDLLFLLRAYPKTAPLTYTNPALPAEVLMEAVRDLNPNIVTAAARNPALPVAGFRLLYASNDRDTLTALLLNPRLPFPAVAGIATRPSLNLFPLAITVIKQRSTEWVAFLTDQQPHLLPLPLPAQVAAIAATLTG